MGQPGSGGVDAVDIDDHRRPHRRHRARPARCAAPGPSHDLDGGLVLPCFVDIHTHLDKGHIWPRTPNPDGTLLGALLTAVRRPRAALVGSRRRAPHGFLAALRLRARHRGHPHPSRLRAAAARDHLGRCSRRCASAGPAASSCRPWRCSAPTALLDPAELDAVARQAKRSGGAARRRHLHDARARRPRCSTRRSRRPASSASISTSMPTRPAIPAAHALLHLAEAVLETGFDGQGHGRPLLRRSRVQDERDGADAPSTRSPRPASPSSRCRCATCTCRIAQPDGRTPRWRGVTLLHELKAAGVPVAIASDNTRDPFYAYGDLDARRGAPRGRAHPAFRPSAGRWPGTGSRHRLGARRPCRLRLHGAHRGRRAGRSRAVPGPQLDRTAVPAAVRPHRAAPGQGDRHGRCPTIANSTT